MIDAEPSLLRSARPFSLVVALASCGLGLWLGARQMVSPLPIVLAVLIAGLLLQLGVNLINDKTDLPLLQQGDPRAARRREHILLSFRLGLASFAVAVVIGLALVFASGWELFVIGVLGVLGAFAYTTEPFNYKRRGLGVILVFWLMGVLMVVGAYTAVTGEPSWVVFWHSLPLSLLISLLLLGNEIRDVERDREHGIRTLSVRIGLTNARRLFWVLILAAYLLSAIYAVLGWLPGVYWLAVSLPLLVPIARHLHADERVPLPPWTGRLLLVFAIGYALAL